MRILILILLTTFAPICGSYAQEILEWNESQYHEVKEVNDCSVVLRRAALEFSMGHETLMTEVEVEKALRDVVARRSWVPRMKVVTVFPLDNGRYYSLSQRYALNETSGDYRNESDWENATINHYTGSLDIKDNDPTHFPKDTPIFAGVEYSRGYFWWKKTYLIRTETQKVVLKKGDENPPRP